MTFTFLCKEVIVRITCVICKHPIHDWNEMYGKTICVECLKKDFDRLRGEIVILKERLRRLEKSAKTPAPHPHDPA